MSLIQTINTITTKRYIVVGPLTYNIDTLGRIKVVKSTKPKAMSWSNFKIIVKADYANIKSILA